MKHELTPALSAICLGLAACASSPAEDFTYVALGASDAAGIGAVPPTEGYVFEIENALEDRIDTVRLVNLGVPGADVALIENALEGYLATRQDVDVVTLWTGPNDVIRGDDPEDFEANLEDVLGQLREATNAPVFIGNVPNLTELPRFQDEPDPNVTEARVDAFNDAIERQAEQHDAVLVDLEEEGIEDDLVSGADGFHPNNDGHRAIAEEFLEAILPELGLEPTS